MNYNYNPNPFTNYNDPNQMNPHYQTTITTRAICTRCNDQNYYMDPYGKRFECYEHIYQQPSYNQNYNYPQYQNTTTTRTICTRCNDQNYYMDPYGKRFECYEHIYQQPSYNQNYNNPQFQENIYRQPENIISRTFHAIKDCIKCGGRGFMDSFNHRGKYCYDCIRTGGYCPICDNTGYMLSNGDRCECGLY